MNIIISGKNIELTPALKEIIESKLSKLQRYFKNDITVNAVASVEKYTHIFEITIKINSHVIRIEEASDDMYCSIDKAVDKVIRQLRKYKTKLEKHLLNKKEKEAILFANISVENDNDKELEIVKTKKFAIKPMSEQEAILQMELLGHAFFVFANAETHDVNVVYKRKDGKYGLIEPEFN